MISRTHNVRNRGRRTDITETSGHQDAGGSDVLTAMHLGRSIRFGPRQ